MIGYIQIHTWHSLPCMSSTRLLFIRRGFVTNQKINSALNDVMWAGKHFTRRLSTRRSNPFHVSSHLALTQGCSARLRPWQVARCQTSCRAALRWRPSPFALPASIIRSRQQKLEDDPASFKTDVWRPFSFPVSTRSKGENVIYRQTQQHTETAWTVANLLLLHFFSHIMSSTKLEQFILHQRLTSLLLSLCAFLKTWR